MKNLQPNFAGGILSEGMYARGDLVKYQVGVADAVNCTIRQQGGLANRPGFVEVGMDITGGGEPPTLVPFQFSADEAYVLEFHTGVFRVLLNGAYVLDTTTLDRPITALAVGADPVWDFDTTGLTVGDVVYITGPDTNWLHTKLAVVSAITGGGARLTMESGAPLDTTAGAPDIVGLEVSRVYTGQHPYTAAEMPDVRYAQDADYLYMAHKLHPPHRLRRVGHDNWTSEPVPFGPGIGIPFAGEVLIPTTNASGTGPLHTTATPHGLTVGDVLVRATNEQALRVYEVPSPTTFRVRTLDNQPYSIGANAEFRRNDVGRDPPSGEGSGAWLDNAVIEKYRVAAMTESGEEGPATDPVDVMIDLTFRGSRAVVTWVPMEGAKRYVVYRETGGEFGYIGATEGTFFIDNNIAPDMSQTPQTPRNPFDGPGRYPGVVAFHEQRLFYAATLDDPQVVEGSQTANPLNFSTSFPARDSDALTFRPKHKHVNEVRALVSSSSLMLMTSGGEWALSGGDDGRPLTPNNLYLRPVSYWGSASVEPALIGDVMVMVQRGGRIARDYRVGGDRPTDLTVMASDLFRDATITGWTYCQTPGSVLWVALSSGELVSLTYNAEHDIWGWTRHALGGGGAVRRVASILEGAEDALYAVVERGGLIKTERLTSRYDRDAVNGIYLDAARAITYAAPVNTAHGFLHLAGHTVTALVDGNVYHNLLVGPQGEISIGERQGRHWIAGHPYVTHVRTLPFETETREDGSTVGARRRASAAAVMTERTRGLWVGDVPERMVQSKEWAIMGDDVTSIPLKTQVQNVDFLGDWGLRPEIIVEQRDPLPFTLLGVAPEWHLGG